MVVAINFSDKNFLFPQKLNSLSAILFGKVDKVVNYNPDDIDVSFAEQNRATFTEFSRGYGLWLWKPYFILKTLEEMNLNDYLIYADSGSVYIRNINKLIVKMNQNEDDIVLSQIPLLELQYTSKVVLEHFKGLHFEWTNQVQAGFILIKKTQRTVELIKCWLQACQNIQLLSGEYFFNENDYFIQHREDQSLLSIIAKLQGVKFYSDMSDYLLHPHRYIHNNRQFFKLPVVDDNRKIESPFFLLYRRNNLFTYLLKFFFRKWIF